MSGTIAGIDHVAITAADLEATCAFYDRLFGAKAVVDHAPDGRPLARQLLIGGAVLSVHQAGNGLDLVAKAPTVGAGDICFRWSGTAEDGRRTRSRITPQGPISEPRLGLIRLSRAAELLMVYL